MVSPQTRERLRDPAYLDLHMAGVVAMRQVTVAPWYDAHFLRMFETAKVFLGTVRPDALPGFEAAFAPLHAPADFAVQEIADIFTPEVLDAARQVVANLPLASLETHELPSFGRHVVHDHPEFVKLQVEMAAMVGELAGQEVEPGYNFLSLYGNAGRCGLHMDQPISMYTLDICLDQTVDWPIWFSDVVDWPDRAAIAAFDEAGIRKTLRFSSYVLRPNSALLFSGSSQWHYRDAMPAPGTCNLLFFHYYPKGCLGIVDPANWPGQFALPELEPLIELFREAFPRDVGFARRFG